MGRLWLRVHQLLPDPRAGAWLHLRAGRDRDHPDVRHPALRQLRPRRGDDEQRLSDLHLHGAGRRAGVQRGAAGRGHPRGGGDHRDRPGDRPVLLSTVPQERDDHHRHGQLWHDADGARAGAGHLGPEPDHLRPGHHPDETLSGRHAAGAGQAVADRHGDDRGHDRVQPDHELHPHRQGHARGFRQPGSGAGDGHQR